MNDTGSTSMLRARGLRKEYGKEAGLVRAVDEVDLDVAPAETVAVMGPERLREVHAAAPARRAWTGPQPGNCGWPGSASTR